MFVTAFSLAGIQEERIMFSIAHGLCCCESNEQLLVVGSDLGSVLLVGGSKVF